MPPSPWASFTLSCTHRDQWFQYDVTINEPHLQIIPLKRTRTRRKLDDTMRGERDVILIHNLPHALAAFGDTVHLDSLPEDLVIPMRLEFFRVFCWEDGVFQALLG
jgi:hypothetical protein